MPMQQKFSPLWLAASLTLSPATAWAINDLSQPPTSAVYWHQDSTGLVIPSFIGADEAYDYFGSAVASGDFDGDGYDDLAVGTPGEDVQIGPENQFDVGAITILHGGPNGLGVQDSSTFNAAQQGAQLGLALATGDINGDGYDDLVAGKPYQDDGTSEDAGQIMVGYGSATGLTSFEYLDQDSAQIGNNSEANDRFGASVAVGDIDNDGFADVAVGTPGESFGSSGLNSGAVYVLFGADDGLQGSNAPRGYEVIVEDDANLAYASVAGNQYGYSVLFHDLDGDGYDELVVGTPGSDIQDTDAGLVYVHPSDGFQIVTTGTSYLAPGGFEISNYADHFFFGSALSGGDTAAPLAGRLLLIGAPGYNEGGFDVFIGRAYLYRPGNNDDEDIVLVQHVPSVPQTNDEFGRAVLHADLNDDGLANERIVSAPGENGGRGAVQMRVPIGKPYYIALQQGGPGIGGAAEVDDRFGEVLARGNFNGRNGDELVVGIPNEGIGTLADAGMVLVLSWDSDDVIFADGFE